MFNKMYVMFADTFFQSQEKGGDCWIVIKCSVPLILLHELYNRTIKEGGIPIEGLSVDKKLKYYSIACKYYNEPELRIKASKAAYMLALITSND